MKKIIAILIIIASIYGCKKNENEIPKFISGTYTGEKTLFYSDTHYETSDTITIKFDSTSYIYSGTDLLDFGRGKYVVQNSSIEFKDDEARIALYSWEWILGGVYKFQITDDQMILNQNGSHLQISCRLRKIPE